MIEEFHELCVFDESTPVPSLVFSTAAPPNGWTAPPACAKPPCWRMRGSSLKFKSNPASTFGVTGMSFTGGAASKNMVKGKGPSLFVGGGIKVTTPPPYSLPLRVQVRARDGACWEATISAAGVRSNTATRFDAKSD